MECAPEANSLELSDTEKVDSVSGPAGLSEMQRAYARCFVQNGGKGIRAAVQAGYSAKGASTIAARNLTNRKILAEIKRLSIIHVEAALPVAIRTLIDVCMNSTDPKARVMAANSLLDRGGLAAPKGGVQVNVGVQVNGSQVQALIGEIWKTRDARISGSSDISDRMSDTSEPSQEAIEAYASELTDPLSGGVGGGSVARVPSSTCPNTSVLPHETSENEEGRDA